MTAIVSIAIACFVHFAQTQARPSRGLCEVSTLYISLKRKARASRVLFETSTLYISRASRVLCESFIFSNSSNAKHVQLVLCVKDLLLDHDE